MNFVNNLSNINLTNDQQRLLSMYIRQYNQTNDHIEQLLDMLDEIRMNIVNVVSSNLPRRTRLNRHSRNSNANLNRIINQIFNEHQNNYVQFDYSTPINRNLYYENLLNVNPLGRLLTTQNDETSISNILSNFLNSSVVVRPSREQIQNASRTIRYGEISNPVSETCPISLEVFNQNDMVRQLLPCGHLFHEQQFNQWFETNVRCPVCRYDIRNYRPLSRRNTPIDNTNNNLPTVEDVDDEDDESEEETSNNSNSNSNSNSNQNSNSRNSREIDTFIFDITNTDISNNLMSNLTRSLLQSYLNPSQNTNTNSNSNSTFNIDPSNNILFYESILRPNRNNNNNNN
jgi:hypothetical protein